MTLHCYKWTLPVLLTAACILARPAGSLGAEMAAGLDREMVYLGTQTLLVVEVANAGSSEWPVVTPVEGLEISHYGSPGTIRDLFSGSIRRSYRFLINPTRAGVFEIPSVTVGEGPDAARKGPFTLHVQEAPLKFVSAQVTPPQIRPGETATLAVVYQGTTVDKDLVLPAVKGLTLRQTGPPRVEITRSEGMPVSIYQIEVSGTENGTYQIEGVSLADVPAEPVTVRVSPFVIADAQAAESSVVVGGQTLVHIVTRGLSQGEDVSLVLPAGLSAKRASQQYQGPPGTTVFSFEVTAKEPGSPTIGEIQLADGRKATLPKPIVLSVRQDILACRGSARSQETVVGEPFIIDYEVFFRGELQAARIDVSQAEFAGRPYITVEPVQNLSYEGWSGRTIPVQYGERGHATSLSGSGDLDGKKEQLLRFALKVTPLAAGEVDLKGVRVILRLAIKDEQRSGGMYFSSMRSQDFSRTIDVPAHRVTDPPGKVAPAGYRGLVGTGLTYTTSLDRTTATAMSPLTLTLKITGEGVTSQIKPPPLAEIRDLNRDYDISPSTGGGDVQDKTITFTQVVRPRTESVKELPALPLVYYDYVKKDYETVYSLPIAVTVTPGSVVGATAMQTRTTREAPAAESATSDATTSEIVPLGANCATLGELATAASLGPAGVIVILLGGPLVIAGVWAGRTWRNRRQPAASLRRQQQELIHQLDEAGGQADFYTCLARVVQSYLRLTFALPGGELSADTLAQVMDRKGLDARLRCQIGELLAVCDTGRFASRQASESERNRLIEQARQVLAALDRI